MSSYHSFIIQSSHLSLVSVNMYSDTWTVNYTVNYLKTWFESASLYLNRYICHRFSLQVPDDEMTEVSEATDATDISEASDQDNNKKVRTGPDGVLSLQPNTK